MVQVLVGASHLDVSLDELEALAVGADGLALGLVTSSGAVAGALVLSTCNRLEVYLDIDEAQVQEGVDAVLTAISDRTGIGHARVSALLRVVVGPDVAQHLFAVASGLESMVVGDGEISGQVRDALAFAQEEGSTSPSLERLVRRALATSKAVTTATGIGSLGRSVVSVGLDVLERRHGTVADRRALILGTGSYARVVVAALERRGCTDIGVFSPSGRAGIFSRAHDVRSVEREGLPAAVGEADLIAACSGARNYIVDVPLLASAQLDTRSALPILDLSLSPDVAPEVHAAPLIDVIDLRVIQQSTPQEHASALEAAQKMVREAARSFEHDERGRGAEHAVVALRTHIQGIVDSEIERISRRVDAATAEEVSRALRRATHAILHRPSVRAQEYARADDVAEYSRAVHALFGIDVDAGG